MVRRPFVDPKVGLVKTDLVRFVDHAYFALDVRLEYAQFELDLHRTLIDSLQEAVAKNIVELERRPDDRISDIVVK